MGEAGRSVESYVSKRIGKLNGIFAPVFPGAHPRNPTAWTPHRLCIQLPAPTRSARWRGLGCVSRVLRGRGPGHGRWWQAREGRWHTGVHRLRTPVTDGTTPRVVGLVLRFRISVLVLGLDLRLKWEAC